MKQRQCCDLSGDARTLILSQRAWNKLFYIPLVYEFEDLIASVDSAHIVAPPFLHTGRMDAMLYRGSNFLRARYGRMTDPGIPTIELERDYDLFFCLLNFAYEVPSFRRLEKLRSRAKHAVCMFVEVWSSHAEQYRRSLELLNELEFDHVFVNLSACLPAVRKVLRRPCSFLPLAVDARRFRAMAGSARSRDRLLLHGTPLRSQSQSLDAACRGKRPVLLLRLRRPLLLERLLRSPPPAGRPAAAHTFSAGP